MQLGFHCEKEVQIKPHDFFNPQRAFVSGNQRASFACVFVIRHYKLKRKTKNATLKTQIPPLTCDPGGGGIRRRFKQSL